MQDKSGVLTARVCKGGGWPREGSSSEIETSPWNPHDCSLVSAPPLHLASASMQGGTVQQFVLQHGPPLEGRSF